MGRSGPTPDPARDPPETRIPGRLNQRQLDDALAAEYVSQVLSAEERGVAEERLRHDPGFAAAVARWQRLMAGLPPDLTQAGAAAPVADRGPPVMAPRQRRGFIRDMLRFLAGALAAFALIVVTIGLVAQPRPGLVARLATADGRLSYEISDYGAALKVARVTGSGASGAMVHELWLMAPGEDPVSLGILDAESLLIEHAMPPPGSRFAVTLEKQGGAPGGRPLGPTILIGEIGS